MIAGEIAAIGSFRYCRRSSSAIGSVEKYENLPVSGNHLAAKTRGEFFHGHFGLALRRMDICVVRL